MKICLDAGHGGNDTGAVGPTGLEEATLVLTISKLVASWLDVMQQEVLLTRESDVFVELSMRCDVANDWGADYFVSVHANSNGSSAVGIETLYTSDRGFELSIPIQSELVEGTGDVDRGLKQRDDLFVLNGTLMPATLTEIGFISHPETESKFRTTNYQGIVAGSIVRGIARFLNIKLY